MKKFHKEQENIIDDVTDKILVDKLSKYENITNMFKQFFD